MKRGKKVGIAALVVALLVAAQSAPIFLLRNPGMQVWESEHATIYHDAGDERSAARIAQELDATIGRLQAKLEDEPTSKTVIYVYKEQSSLHMRKYGLVTLLFSPDWYVGDNRGEIALITSPYAEVSGHDTQSILSALPHEIVHTINFRKNPRLSYFLDNGVATYLSDQRPPADFRVGSPYSLENKWEEDELRFGETNGYAYCYTYIAFLDETYGWDAVLRLISGEESHEEIFGRSEEQIYEAWMDYLDARYPIV